MAVNVTVVTIFTQLTLGSDIIFTSKTAFVSPMENKPQFSIRMSDSFVPPKENRFEFAIQKTMCKHVKNSCWS